MSAKLKRWAVSPKLRPITAPEPWDIRDRAAISELHANLEAGMDFESGMVNTDRDSLECLYYTIGAFLQDSAA